MAVVGVYICAYLRSRFRRAFASQAGDPAAMQARERGVIRSDSLRPR